MGDLDGRVALVTGAARGQGRQHAVRLAEAGADILALDVCAPVSTVPYPMADRADLDRTVELVEQAGRRIVARVGDVRRQEDLDALVVEGIAQFGHVDIVCANAGVGGSGKTWELSESEWGDLLDINLSGVWRTVKAAVPAMIAAERGGSIIVVASVASFLGLPNISHYASSKHAVLGLMRSLANELGEHRIRVNAICPGNVDTELFHNPVVHGLMRPDLQAPTVDDVRPVAEAMNLLGVDWMESDAISELVLWLASDRARYVNGTSVVIDAGWLAKST